MMSRPVSPIRSRLLPVVLSLGLCTGCWSVDWAGVYEGAGHTVRLSGSGFELVIEELVANLGYGGSALYRIDGCTAWVDHETNHVDAPVCLIAWTGSPGISPFVSVSADATLIDPSNTVVEIELTIHHPEPIGPMTFTVTRTL